MARRRRRISSQIAIMRFFATVALTSSKWNSVTPKRCDECCQLVDERHRRLAAPAPAGHVGNHAERARIRAAARREHGQVAIADRPVAHLERPVVLEREPLPHAAAEARRDRRRRSRDRCRRVAPLRGFVAAGEARQIRRGIAPLERLDQGGARLLALAEQRVVDVREEVAEREPQGEARHCLAVLDHDQGRERKSRAGRAVRSRRSDRGPAPRARTGRPAR